jgi:hypothetical protein
MSSGTGTSTLTSDYVITKLQVPDMLNLMILASNEFRGTCRNANDFLVLHHSILTLFSSKFLQPEKMGHSLIGVKDSKNSLVGFVDLSLQVRAQLLWS